MPVFGSSLRPLRKKMTTTSIPTRPMLDSLLLDAAWQSARALRTPCVALHGKRLDANIRDVGDLAKSHRVSVRPHAKTHKCVEIAQMQMAQGAVGITVA